jgi:hypothetical protein
MCLGFGLRVRLLLAALLPACWADTLDIEVAMYSDQNCFQRFDNLLLLDDSCYANLYSNLTKAYKLKIVGFTGEKKMDLFEYSDACHTQFSPKRTIEVGKCRRFVGSFFAITKIRLRSSTCVGPDCSRLAVVVNKFFSEKACAGLPYQIYTHPVQDECLRWSNGTQGFTVDPTNTNITQMDYLMNDKCKGDLRRRLTIQNDYCYELYKDKVPKSFRWTITRYDDTASADAWRPTSLAAAAAVAPLAFLPSPDL